MTARNGMGGEVGFSDALIAKGPCQEFAYELRLFGQFVGS